MKTNIKVIATSLTLAASVGAVAGMSGLNVQSHLGQPFSGSIVVSGDEARALIAEGRVSVSGGIRATLIPQGEDRVLVRLRSSSPVREPILTFTVSAGRQTREYTAILDPIRYTPKAAPAVERTISSSPNYQDVQRDMTHTQKVRHTNRNSDAQLQALKKSSKVAVSPRRHRAHAGDSLANIAERYRPQNMSLQTAMRALMLANPSAFKHGTTIRRNVTLYIPTESQWHAYAKRAQKRSQQAVRAPQRVKKPVIYQIDTDVVDDNVAVAPKTLQVPKTTEVKPVQPAQQPTQTQVKTEQAPVAPKPNTNTNNTQPAESVKQPKPVETQPTQPSQPATPPTPPKPVETQPVQPVKPSEPAVVANEASKVAPKPASQEKALMPSNASNPNPNTDAGAASVATKPVEPAVQGASNTNNSNEVNKASAAGASTIAEQPSAPPPVTEQPPVQQPAPQPAPVAEEVPIEEETDWLMLGGGAAIGLGLVGGAAALVMRRRRQQNEEESWATEEDDNDYIPARDVDDEWGDTDIILSNNHNPKPISSTNFEDFDEFDDSAYTTQAVASSSASSNEFNLDNFDDNQDFVTQNTSASASSEEVVVDGDWDWSEDENKATSASSASFASTPSSSSSSVVLDENDTFDLNDFGSSSNQNATEQEWSLDAAQDIKPVFASEEQSFSLDDFVVEETPVVAPAPSVSAPVAEDLTFDLSEFDTPAPTSNVAVEEVVSLDSFDTFDTFDVVETPAPVVNETIVGDEFGVALDAVDSFETTFEVADEVKLNDFVVDVPSVVETPANSFDNSFDTLDTLDTLNNLDNLDTFDLPVVDDAVLNDMPVESLALPSPSSTVDVNEDLAFGLDAFDDNFAVPSVDNVVEVVETVDVPVVEDDLSFGLDAFEEMSLPVVEETSTTAGLDNSHSSSGFDLDELLATDGAAALDSLSNQAVLDDFVASPVVPNVATEFASLETVDLSAFESNNNEFSNDFALDNLDNLDVADDVLLATPEIAEPIISLDAPEVSENMDFGDLGSLDLAEEVFATQVTTPIATVSDSFDSFDHLLADEPITTATTAVATEIEPVEVGMMDLTTGPLASDTPVEDVFATNLDEFELVDEQQVLDWQEEGAIKTNATNAGFVSGAVSDMTEPLEAKFELAKMYLEIDDANAARETLRELIAESSGQIQAEATQLLAELGN